MRSELLDPVVDSLVVLFYAVVSAVLTYEGVLSELAALGQFTGGEVGLGVWYLFVGALALYAGVGLVGRDLLLPRLRARLP
jgi:hypothetical protein